MKILALLFLFACCLQVTGQSTPYDSAVAHAKSDLAARRLDQALAEAGRAIGLDPSRWEAYTVAAGASIKQHRCDVARDYVQKAIARAPSEKQQGLTSLLSQCSAVATSPLKGQEEEARKEKEAITARALNERLSASNEAVQVGNYDQAISILKQATQLDASRDLLWAKLGDAYCVSASKQTDATAKQARLQQAIASYSQAIAIKPTGAYYNNLADAYAKTGKLDDAVKTYALAAQVDPAEAATYLFNEGAVLTNAGKTSDAVQVFDKVIAIDPSKADAYYWKGLNMLADARIDKAGKIVAPPGTAAALNMYLRLQPAGQYATAAKQMLDSTPLAIFKAPTKEIVSKTNISDQNIANYYNGHKPEFNFIEPQYHLAQILVRQARILQDQPTSGARTETDPRKTIEMVLNRLQNGDDFGTLAMKYSDDGRTASSGGDLGLVSESALRNADSATRDAVMSLKPGQCSTIITLLDAATQKLVGFRIVKLVGKEPAGQRELSDPRVRQAILTKLQDPTGGEAFLAANKIKDGILTTGSGLQYEILRVGTGPKPTASDVVTCNYRATLIDGKEFDSTDKRGHPATFPVRAVIKGFAEALQMMPVGSRWKLFVPSSLGYGDRGIGDIGANAVLIYDIELLSIQNNTGR